VLTGISTVWDSAIDQVQQVHDVVANHLCTDTTANATLRSVVEPRQGAMSQPLPVIVSEAIRASTGVPMPCAAGAAGSDQSMVSYIHICITLASLPCTELTAISRFATDRCRCTWL
jgi:hypothetical protein